MHVEHHEALHDVIYCLVGRHGEVNIGQQDPQCLSTDFGESAHVACRGQGKPVSEQRGEPEPRMVWRATDLGEAVAHGCHVRQRFVHVEDDHRWSVGHVASCHRGASHFGRYRLTSKLRAVDGETYVFSLGLVGPRCPGLVRAAP
jgi:hypothetical protein